MAYMGRGGFPSSGNNSGGELGPNDNNNNCYSRGRFYGDSFLGVHYYVPLDNTYVIFQMIATIIIFLIAGVTLLATYTPSVIDPIEGTKKAVFNTYIIIVLLLVAFTLLANYFSKDKNALIKRLIALLATSLITALVFLGIKVNLDSTYTKNKFEQIYIQENGEQTTDTKTRINIGGLTGIQLKTEKDYYVDECVKAYKIFSIRMYIVIGINIFLIILLIYQISKVSQIQETRDRMNKDEEVLFDEEENVKF